MGSVTHRQRPEAYRVRAAGSRGFRYLFCVQLGRIYNLPQFTSAFYYLPLFTLTSIICHVLDQFLYNLPFFTFVQIYYYS